MAMDLVAKLKLDDRFSGPMRKAERQTQRMLQTTNTYQSTLGKVDTAQDRMTRAISRTDKALDHAKRTSVATRTEFERLNRTSLGGGNGGGISGALSSVTASAGAAGAAVAGIGFAFQIAAAQARFLMNTTKAVARTLYSFSKYSIINAADLEFSVVGYNAMFGPKARKQADEFFAHLKVRANKSLYGMQDFVDSARSLIPVSKDVDLLKKMTNMAERLAVVDPIQGLSGATLALREYFGGKDVTSLAERFELPRKVLNEWKNLPIEQQIKHLDKYLEKVGIGNALITEAADTAKGQWLKATGSIKQYVTEIGAKGLQNLAPLLKKLNDYLDSDSFVYWKNQAIAAFDGLTKWLASKGEQLGSWIEKSFLSNEAFRAASLTDKMSMVFDGISKSFKDWYANGGEDKISKTVTDMVQGMRDMLIELSPTIGSAAWDVGKAFADGFAKAAKDGLTESIKDPLPKTINVFGKDVSLEGAIKAVEPGAKKFFDLPAGLGGLTPKPPGHAGGLDRVPYNGYTARLHRDEMVLTRSEAQNYRESGGTSGGNGRPVTIHIANMNVRQESDIDAIADKLARRIAW